jgi:hypothetical protein
VLGRVHHRPEQDLATGSGSSRSRSLAFELGRIETIEHARDAFGYQIQARADRVATTGHREFASADAIDLLTGELLDDVILGRAERVRRQHQQTVRVLPRRPPVDLLFGEAVECGDDVAKEPQQIVAELRDLAISDASDGRCAASVTTSR